MPTDTLKPWLEPDPIEGIPHYVGRDPRALSQDDLKTFGHEPMPLLKAIRAKCLDCCGENAAEVRRCVAVKCALWPFRTNTNPWRAPLSEAQREAARVAGRRLAEKTAGNRPPQAAACP